MSTASKDNPKGHANKDGPSLGRTSPMLSYFCVYNPDLGAKSDENNKEQILFYTAKTVVPLDVKLRQVGLAQALVNFTSYADSHIDNCSANLLLTKITQCIFSLQVGTNSSYPKGSTSVFTGRTQLLVAYVN